MYKRNGIWWFTCIERGKRYYRSTGQRSRRLADQFEKAFYEKKGLSRTKLSQGNQEVETIPSKAKVTVSEVLQRYWTLHLDGNKKPSAERAKFAFERMVKYFGPRTSISDIRFRIDEYKADRRQTVKPSSVKRELSFLKAACVKAKEWGILDKNPLDGYKLDKVNDSRLRYLEDEEFHCLLESADENLVPILLMARHQGMRQGEIRHLKWEDVDMRRGIIHIPISKSGERRDIPMTEVIGRMLMRIPVKEREGLVFKYDGKEIKRQGWLMHSFRRAVRKAGIKDFRFHDLRHTFASHAVMNGGGLAAVGALLGHKSMKMTQRYAHLAPRYLRATISRAVPKIFRVPTKLRDNSATSTSQIPSVLEAYKTRNASKNRGVSKWCPQGDLNPCYGLERAVT